MPSKEYKGRHVEVYLPTEELFRKWTEKAKEAGMKRSSWVIARVEAAEEESLAPKIAGAQSELKEENRRLRQELELKDRLLQAQETELFNLRNAAFLGPIRGKAHLEERLVEALRSGGVWSSNDLLKELGVDSRDGQSMQALVGQLQLLQDYGLVVESARGWSWAE
jgi:hypothetical protein